MNGVAMEVEAVSNPENNDVEVTLSVPPIVVLPGDAVFRVPLIVVLFSVDGIMLAFSKQKLGTADDPVQFPKMVFADCEFSETLNTPVEVMGEPVTAKILGIDSPTLDTVACPFENIVYDSKNV